MCYSNISQPNETQHIADRATDLQHALPLDEHVATVDTQLLCR